jgi:tetratricopeptide (TPR) repeat protein
VETTEPRREIRRYCAVPPEVINIHETVLGKYHHTTAEKYKNMVLLYKNVGDYDNELASARVALAINRQLYGSSHPRTTSVHDCIGDVFFHKGHYPESLAEFRKILAIRESVFDGSGGTLKKNHDGRDKIGETYLNIGKVFQTMGDHEGALVVHEKAGKEKSHAK